MVLSIHYSDSTSDSLAPDVYFTSAYGAAEEASGSGKWIDLQAWDGRWRMPLHLRSDEGFVDGVSPYGYAGLFVDPQLGAGEAQRAWGEAVQCLRDMGVLSVFLRQSPLVGKELVGGDFRTVIANHPTVCLTVGSSERAWDDMEGRSRTSIRKAERMGLSVEVREATHPDLRAGSAFRLLYEDAMRRRSADKRYFFPDGYYERLLRGLRGELLLASVTDDGGVVVAAALLMRHGDLLHYHLSGSAPDAGRVGATNLMVWGAMRWAAESEIEKFHLGGGVADGDSLFKFKRSFGGETLRFSAYGAVIDSPGYQRAVDTRAAQLGCPPADLLSDRFFPQFRVGM